MALSLCVFTLCTRREQKLPKKWIYYRFYIRSFSFLLFLFCRILLNGPFSCHLYPSSRAIRRPLFKAQVNKAHSLICIHPELCPNWKSVSIWKGKISHLLFPFKEENSFFVSIRFSSVQCCGKAIMPWQSNAAERQPKKNKHECHKLRSQWSKLIAFRDRTKAEKRKTKP